MVSVNIDMNGFYIPGSEYEDKLGDGISQPPNGFWKPKWDGEQWVEGMEELNDNYNYPPDWTGLLDEVRGTPTFAKVYTSSKDSLPVNVAYTLLLATLTSNNPHINDLAFALYDLKANMLNLTSKDIEFINQVLAKYHFPLTL